MATRVEEEIEALKRISRFGDVTVVEEYDYLDCYKEVEQIIGKWGMSKEVILGEAFSPKEKTISEADVYADLIKDGAKKVAKRYNKSAVQPKKYQALYKSKG